MMRLICARCRYECQTELQRVICPRCASIIDTSVEPLGAPEPLELDQNQDFAYTDEDLDLGSALGLSANDGVLESDLSDEVLDLPESSPVRSYNPAFAEPDSDEEEIVFEEPVRVTTTSPAPEKPISLNTPRVIRLSEPRSAPANPEPMYFVPRERLAILQGRSWRGPAMVAAIALAGFGLYSLQGRLSPSARPATSPAPVAAKKTGSTPAPAPSKVSSAAAVQPTVIPAANAPVTTAPIKTARPADLARTDKKPEVERKKNDRTTDAVPIQGDGKLTVQVASFPSEQEAKERVEYLKSVGVPAQIVRADLGKRGIYFRVMTGRFMKPDDARKYGQQLLSKGKVQEFVVARL
jgi:cell division septation protein DedD